MLARIVPDALQRWPLPPLADDADKEGRGRLLLIGGSGEIPGALLLAATAAMRAGGGKLTLATASRVAPALALQMPEARVIALPETAEGGLAAEGAERVLSLCADADAILVGPGMQDSAGSIALIRAIVQQVPGERIVLDALAMDLLRVSAEARGGQGGPLLTPHYGEMAHLSGLDKDLIREAGAEIAQEWAARWQCPLLLKGPTTWLASPEGLLFEHRGGLAGLAMSGSGDVLAGVITGLLARSGGSLLQAAAWAVACHNMAGQYCARTAAEVGYLARELADCIPQAMQELQGAFRAGACGPAAAIPLQLPAP